MAFASPFYGVSLGVKVVRGVKVVKVKCFLGVK